MASGLPVDAVSLLPLPRETVQCRKSNPGRRSATQSLDIYRSGPVNLNCNESEILDWCVAYLASTFKMPREHIRPHAKFASLGMDSAASVFFIVELEEWLGIELPTEIVFTFQTPGELARHIAARYGAQSGTRS
jgi:acyl carrier protein